MDVALHLPLEGSYPSFQTDNKSPQLLKDAALEHAGMLHPDDSATSRRVIIAHETPRGWRERSYRVDQLPDVVQALAGETDAYISQQRFECKRLITQLWQLGAMYVDLDYHKVPELRDMHPLGVLEDALIALERAQKPAPTLAIFSGRGMYLIWLHTPVPRKALPRWNACQRELWEVLKHFGADRGALDAARVLRIAGTINSKSGAVVEQIAPPGEVWEFEDLAGEILPLERADVRDIRIQKAARAARMPRKALWIPHQGFNEGTLWAGRLRDLQRLRGIRFLGDLPPGQRDIWMLLAGVAMSWIAIPPVLRRELWELAKEAARWDNYESGKRLSAIMKRAHMAARKEKIEWPPGSGRMIDARYHFKNQTIIEWLEITADEEEEMDVIISRDEKRRRDRERTQQKRREAGMLTRAEYEATADQRRLQVAELRAGGYSQREIAEVLGCTQQEISRLLKTIDKAIQQSVPLYGGIASPKGISQGGLYVPSEDRTEYSPPQTERVRSQGEIIEAKFRAAENHPLSCDCEYCSVPAPRYARVRDEAIS